MVCSPEPPNPALDSIMLEFDLMRCHIYDICLTFHMVFWFPQDKILQSTGRGHNVTVTNDGATILKSLHIDSPAAKVLIGILKRFLFLHKEVNAASLCLVGIIAYVAFVNNIVIVWKEGDVKFLWS